MRKLFELWKYFEFKVIVVVIIVLITEFLRDSGIIYCDWAMYFEMLLLGFLLIKEQNRLLKLARTLSRKGSWLQRKKL